MSSPNQEPGECLRELTADALRQAESGTPVMQASLGVRAVVNAFVLLGLMTEAGAGKITGDFREALGARGLGTAWGPWDGELGSAAGAAEVREAHAAGPAPLAGLPLAAVPAGVSFPASVSGLPGEIRFEWVRMTAGEIRVSFRACADDPGGEPDRPNVVMREALARISVAGDTGHRYRPRVEGVTWDRVPPDRQEWRGDLVAAPDPAAPGPDWLEFSSAEAHAARRVRLRPPGEPAGVPVSAARPRWPTPAEGYLAALARDGGTQDGGAGIGADLAARAVAAVADCLLATGALPADSAVLREAPVSASWQRALAARWARRAEAAAARLAPGRHAMLLAELPFRHASAVIEGVIADGQMAGITLRARPWAAGDEWPAIAPCFTVHAAGDSGAGYEGVPGGFRAGPGLEGSGTFWFWPPVPDDCQSLTVTVGTLWEAARARVPLPGRASAAAAPAAAREE